MFFEMDADHRDRRPKGSSPDEPLDDPLRTPIGALSAFVSAPIWTCSTFARCRAFRGCISSDSQSCAASRSTLENEFMRRERESLSLPDIRYMHGQSGKVSMVLAFGNYDFGVAIVAFDRAATANAFVDADLALARGFLDRSSAIFDDALLSSIANRTLALARYRMQPALLLLDEHLAIVCEDIADGDLRSRELLDGRRLQERFLKIVEVLRTELGEANPSVGSAAVAVFDSHIVRLRCFREATFYLLSIERYRQRDSISAASRRFGFSEREIDVISRLLDGSSVARIASELFIAPSTVEYHVRNLFAKTQASNRTDLVARVLGWFDNTIPVDRPPIASAGVKKLSC